jgi:hypothetical protein
MARAMGRDSRRNLQITLAKEIGATSTFCRVVRIVAEVIL